MKNVSIFVKNLTSGGAEKQSVLLAKALCETCNVHYIILNSKYQEAKYMRLLADTPKITVVTFKGSLLRRFINFTKYLRDKKIEYIFSYLTAANFYAVVASRIVGVKNVYTGIRNAYLPPTKALIDRLLCNHYSKGAILNCYAGERYFLTQGFVKDKLTVIPNCFENIKEYQQKESNPEILNIISVGRFVEQKDYFTALTVVDNLRKANLNLCYQIVGYGELETEIRQRVLELNLENHVKIAINPDNIPELLDQADVYLSTSLFEGTSNSIMEAMNANLPIVATDVGDNYMLIKHGQNGFIAGVKDVKQIESHIKMLLEDEQLRIEMGRKSKALLLENYSIEKFRERYEKLID
ncbi:glycosyltransferase family 4 protein [Pedobacter faecalis]|uniref:glycosyltransferase family 4 protein n=1 Tax=Pedobacter faecalis TaxID=3041495 RepID=UPI00254D2F5D|nr:glycosyltransferase family 4 protein [Pedobacter sp. ELA7]